MGELRWQPFYPNGTKNRGPYQFVCRLCAEQTSITAVDFVRALQRAKRDGWSVEFHCGAWLYQCPICVYLAKMGVRIAVSQEEITDEEAAET